jgi:hypothetical protein
MDLEELWQQVFSENAPQVRAAWSALDAEERRAVHDLLVRISADQERASGQREAAQFALEVLAAAPGASNLPDGALAFARELAAETGRHLCGRFGQHAASTKHDGTLVTASDLDSDRRLSAAIAARYPGHGVLSEETARIYRGEEWCWVVDPIDGTTNFARGFPIWGVLIALLHHGQPVLGVADFPMLGEQYWAAHAQGAWLNDAPIRTAELGLGADGLPQIEGTHLFACCTRTLRSGTPPLPMT